MWIRRVPSEIVAIETRKRRRRFSPIAPMFLALGLMLIDWGVRRNTLGAFSLMSSVFFLSVLTVFSLLYLSRVLLGRYQLFTPSPFSVPRKATMICVQCHSVQTDTESHVCACGGHLEPVEHWRWLTDEADSNSRP